MKTETHIPWANYTTNVVTGCHKPAALPAAGMRVLEAMSPAMAGPAVAKWTLSGTSPECIRCYAESLSLRRGWTKFPWRSENAAANVVLHPERMREWGKLSRTLGQPADRPPSERLKFFVCSMGDIFHELVPDSFLCQCFAEFRRYPDEIFLLLTKRTDRAADQDAPWCQAAGGWPANVWLGTSIGHPVTKWRLEYLRKSPARIRFVSMEPLVASLTDAAADAYYAPLHFAGIDQAIVGGESGAGYRPMQMQWARELRDRAAASGTAFFYKQDAAFRAGERPWLVEADGRRMEYLQFPGELTPPRLVMDDESRVHSEPFPMVT